MSAGTVNVNFKFDVAPLRRATLNIRLFAGNLRIALSGSKGQQREQQTYDLGRELAAEYPDLWECFCVTTNEGRCRVVSRPRGGWTP